MIDQFLLTQEYYYYLKCYELVLTEIVDLVRLVYLSFKQCLGKIFYYILTKSI